MSLEDFEQMGLLRDKRQWGPERSSVRGLGLAAASVVSLTACGLMVYGDGGWWTGAGVALFLVGLFALIALNLHGIKRLDQR